MPSSNMSIVTLKDGRQVLLSYGVPVAAHLPRQSSPGPLFDQVSGFVATERRYNQTTSQHVNTWCGVGYNTVTRLPDDQFLALIAPLTNPRGPE